MDIDFLSILLWNNVQDRVLALQIQCDTCKNDQRTLTTLHKELAFLENVLTAKTEIETLYIQKNNLEKEMQSNSDNELEILYKEEIAMIASQIQISQDKIKDMIYQDDLHEHNALFIEIRAGTGGQEASLFVSDLARMYTLFAQKKNLSLTITDAAYTEVGGCREIILHIDNKEAFGWLQFESGVHRVQRVPVTENAGRVHTSTATVAILPEVDEVTVVIDPKDLRIDTYRASGAGGQHVNKTDSAVRITHIPSGIVVQCQDERSQHKNKARAMKALQAKLFALEQDKQTQNISKARKDMVSNADRSEKIRTYNFPQNRITDHRFGVTLNQLDFILNGAFENLATQILAAQPKKKKIHPYIVPFLSIHT